MINDELLNKFAKIQDIPVPEEILGAYLEGNCDRIEANDIENIVANNPTMEELVAMLEIVDNEIYNYINDEFGYDADITALDNYEITLPDIEIYNSPTATDNNSGYKKDSILADDSSSTDEKEDPYSTIYSEDEIESEIVSLPDISIQIPEIDNTLSDFPDYTLDNDY